MSNELVESQLSASASDIHRALSSLQEELEAIDLYHQRAEATKDGELRALLIHNRDDEAEHAAMLLEWIRRAMPELDGQLRKFLFKPAVLTETVGGATTSPNPAAGLGVGNLK